MPIDWKLIALSAIPASPWRNGGGSTRELLTWPAQADWAVRLSVAEISQNGPFSAFNGVHRWFAVLSGDGVALRVDGQECTLTPESPPFAFAGSANTECRMLGGPSQDFNLMSRSSRSHLQRVQGTVQLHTSAVAHGGAGAQVFAAAYAGHGGASLALAQGGQALLLAPHTLAWCVLPSDRAWQLESTQALCMQVAV